MTRQEILAAHPLPEFVRNRGYALRESATGFETSGCPCTEHKPGHFCVTIDAAKQVWHCNDCDEGGSVIDWVMREENITVADAMAKLGGQGRNDERPRSRSFNWPECVAAFGDKHAAHFAEQRGYSREFVDWLRANAMIGLCNGQLAFPVTCDGKVVAAHVWERGNWRYEPNKQGAHPWVIGKLERHETIHGLESQFDAFALSDKTGIRDGIIITRGASNGEFVAGLVPKNATVLLWTQNDQPDPKTGRVAGDDWQADVCENVTEPTACIKRARFPAHDVNDWIRAGATADDILDVILKAETLREPGRPLIEFCSPMELRDYKPPEGLVLVGDCHVAMGSVFVEGGPPGVGKSLGVVALGVCGVTQDDWFGYTVHRQFKTLIVQSENGRFRLSREFAELDCEALEDFMRVSPPPPLGFCFSRKEFREQLAEAIGEFQPDVVIFDPWNAVAREQTQEVYLDAFDALRSVLPTGDDAPALGIVAHTRKPRADERANGRALLNILAGSYVLGTVPRTVFVQQAASDDVTDHRVVVTCCKNNDGEMGPRSVWRREKGLFVPVEYFDWETFDHPPKGPRGLDPKILRELLTRGRQYSKAQIVEKVMDETGRGKTQCYSFVDEAKTRGVLHYRRLTKIYELA